MPGVPSGKGCDGCRKQKKKCDQAKPSCSRCARLKIPCVGSGQQRYLFKTQEVASYRSSSVSSGDSSRHKSPAPTSVVSNEIETLAAALVAVVQPSTNVRWNVAWTYGDFLLDVPKRLGTNKALDAAVKSLLSAYTDMCVDKTRVSSKTLTLYGQAVSSLRTCLDDAISASTTETLSAVYMIIVQQAFIGADNNRSIPISHGEGAIQIIKARRHKRPSTDFERRLLLTIRGPIIFEAVFNPKIKLMCEDWDDLVTNEFSDPGPVNRIIRFIADVPGFQERGRNVKYHGVIDDSLVLELYDRLVALRFILEKWTTALKDYEKTEYEPGLLHLNYQRMYGLTIMPVLMYNCMLQGLNSDIRGLKSEAATMIQEVVQLAHRSHIYRPLGASYVCICLILAFAASVNEEERRQTGDLLRDYCCDFPGLQTLCKDTALDNTSRHLQLDILDRLQLCI